MATAAANKAVRERRRQSSAVEIEKMNVMKALTAAEYSRRQFVLNFAASKDIQLLVPGQKADVIKEAEEWAVRWLSENGYASASNDFFKYTVDARLWNTLVGGDIEFPFAFMRSSPETPNGVSSESNQVVRPKTATCLANHAVEISTYNRIPSTQSMPLLAKSNSRKSSRKQSVPSGQHEHGYRQNTPSNASQLSVALRLDKHRSYSVNSVDDLKIGSKKTRSSSDKAPLIARWNRLFTRRLTS